MAWPQNVQTVDDLVQFFFDTPIQGGANDCLYTFRTRFMQLANPRQRCTLMYAYNSIRRGTPARSQNPYYRFIRDWGNRMIRKHDANQHTPSTLREIWADRGLGYLREFSGGDSQFAGALREYDMAMTRVIQDRARRVNLAQLETPSEVRAWKERMGAHYRSEAGRNQCFTLPLQSEFDLSGGSGGGYSVYVWPLALWMVHRWSDIINQGHDLSQNLRTAGWAPNRTGTDYRNSFGDTDAAITAGRRLFEQCATQYHGQINALGADLVSHVYGSGHGTLETSQIHPLTASEREAFLRQAAAWGVTNESSGPSPGNGLPANGLPYGSPSGIGDVGTHKDRIAALHQLVQGTGNRDQLIRTVGIRDRVGGPGPRMARWF